MGTENFQIIVIGTGREKGAVAAFQYSTVPQIKKDQRRTLTCRSGTRRIQPKQASQFAWGEASVNMRQEVWIASTRWGYCLRAEQYRRVHARGIRFLQSTNPLPSERRGHRLI